MSLSMNAIENPAVSVPASPVMRLCVSVLRAMCALTLVFIMGITSADVFLRYWFSAPITGSSEMVMFAMAVLIFSSFPLVTLSEQHICVGLLNGKLRGRALSLQRMTVLLVSFAACSLMAWRLWQEGVQLYADQQITMVLQLPLGAVSYVMGVLSGVSALFVLVLIGAHLTGHTVVKEGRQS